MSWNLIIDHFNKNNIQLEESLFSLGNGYLGVRGNLEELYSGIPSVRGTYINAFYDDIDIPYAEKGYAYPETSQKMLNIIDSQTIELEFEDEKFKLDQIQIISYKRTLYTKKGYSERIIHFKTPLGKELRITFKRLVSFIYKELFCQEITVTPINYQGTLKVKVILNGDVENYVDRNDPRVAQGEAKRLKITSNDFINDCAIIEAKTEKSNLSVLTLSNIMINRPYQVKVNWTSKAYELEYIVDLSNTTTIKRINLYFDSIRHDNLKNEALVKYEDIKNIDFENLVYLQESYLKTYYDACDIEIKGNDELQLGMHFNLFHLIQSVGKDKYSNIAAKGLSGEGYEGHYFLDTEIFIFPVFLLTNPEIAKNLILYRYNTLNWARLRAKELGHNKGASFPWRTIKGTECSSFFPASTAQYHINADISYSIVLYYLATNDIDFISQFGAEIVFETARIFIDLGHYNDLGFNIHGVTGPDEYTAIVNNNYFTNALAKYNFIWAVKFYYLLEKARPEVFRELINKLNITETEITEFNRAQEKMYLPYDEKLKINPQDDSFLSKPIWDFNNTSKDKYPLLLHYHLLTIYRHQVCKQADTILSHFLLEDLEEGETIKNTYHYYEKITTHDSSLSSCIFSIMAAKIGEIDKSYDYFMETARMDLDNTHKNTKDGLHMANMGGTYMAIVFGFAGLRIKESGLSFEPRIPKQLTHYRFSIKYQDRIIEIKVTHDDYKIKLIQGNELTIKVNNSPIKLIPNHPYIHRN